MNRHVVPLIKHKQQANENKIKQNIHDDVFVFFQENFGTLTAYVRKDIQAYLNEMSAGLVLHVMKRALDYNKTNWNYVKKILQNWEIKGISCVEEAEKENSQKNAFRSGNNGSAGRKRVVPEWISDDNFDGQGGSDKKPWSKIDVQKEKEELLQLTREYVK